MSSHFLKHPIFNAPIRLTLDQYNKPTEVLTDFFDDYSLADIRHAFWAVVKVCLTTEDYPFDEPLERDSLLALYESLETALEAAFVIAANAPDRITPPPVPE